MSWKTGFTRFDCASRSISTASQPNQPTAFHSADESRKIAAHCTPSGRAPMGRWRSGLDDKRTAFDFDAAPQESNQLNVMFLYWGRRGLSELVYDMAIQENLGFSSSV